MLPEKPCEKCIHKKVCEATKKFDEISITISHPFFKAKIECSEFQHKPEALMKKSDAIYSPSQSIEESPIWRKSHVET